MIGLLTCIKHPARILRLKTGNAALHYLTLGVERILKGWLSSTITKMPLRALSRWIYRRLRGKSARGLTPVKTLALDKG